MSDANTNGAEAVTRAALSDIIRSPWNRTVDPKTLDPKFVANVAEHGIIQPLIVRLATGAPGPWRYELVAGERRLVAANLNQLETVPVIVRELSDTQAIEVQKIENLQREGLNPLEEAEGYEQLIAAYGAEGMGREKAIEHLAQRIGKSKSTIYEALRLLDLSPAMKAAVQSGEVSASQAGLVAKVEGDSSLSDRTVYRVREYVLAVNGEEAPSFRETKKFIDRITGRAPRLIKANPEPGAKFHAVAEQLYPCLCSHCKRAFQMLARGETPLALRTSGRKARAS